MEGSAIFPVVANHYSWFDFVSTSRLLRPLPALPSVKLLNTLFTASHNIASDQKMSSTCRGERSELMPMQSTLTMNPVTHKHLTSQIGGIAYCWLNDGASWETIPSWLGAVFLKAIHQGPDYDAASTIARVQGPVPRRKWERHLSWTYLMLIYKYFTS